MHSREKSFLQAFPWANVLAVLGCCLAALLLWQTNQVPPTEKVLRVVSTQSMESVFSVLNARFQRRERKRSGRRIAVRTSTGGNVLQTTEVLAGDERPDVVAMSLPSSVSQMQVAGLVAEDWETRSPHNASAWYTTLVFVVRKDNPLRLRDWPDLVKIGTGLLIPDPATTALGQTTVLAAWGAVRTSGESVEEAEDFIRRLYQHTLYRVEDIRTLLQLFVVNGEADVLVLREHDALALLKTRPGEFDVVYPPTSLLVTSGVTWLDAHTQRHGTTALAKRYVEFLYSREAQEILALHGFRPTSEQAFAANHARFPHMELFPVTRVAPSWNDAARDFFGSGGLADILYDAEVREVLPPASLESGDGGLQIPERVFADER